jgi:hypothetical protein
MDADVSEKRVATLFRVDGVEAALSSEISFNICKFYFTLIIEGRKFHKNVDNTYKTTRRHIPKHSSFMHIVLATLDGTLTPLRIKR